MAEYITKKKNMDAAQTPTGTRQEALKRRNKKDGYVVITDEQFKKITGAPEIGKDIVIIAPGMQTKKGKKSEDLPRNNFKRGGPVCKLATKGKGRAYGKNS
jgi:hypothetical protein